MIDNDSKNMYYEYIGLIFFLTFISRNNENQKH